MISVSPAAAGTQVRYAVGYPTCPSIFGRKRLAGSRGIHSKTRYLSNEMKTYVVLRTSRECASEGAARASSLRHVVL